MMEKGKFRALFLRTAFLNLLHPITGGKIKELQLYMHVHAIEKANIKNHGSWDIIKLILGNRISTLKIE